MVCLFFDKGDYKEEIKDIRSFARRLAWRTNLRVGLVTDPKLVKRLKREQETAKYFPNEGLSSCALRRYDGTFHVYDFTGVTINMNEFELWTHQQSKRPIE